MSEVRKRKREVHPLLVGLKDVESFSLMDSAAMYDEKAPPMLIDTFLPAGGVMGITSYPGVGKTWLTLEVVRAVATGSPFLGRFPTRRGGVFFVGSDSSVYDYARQWKRLTIEEDTQFGGKYFDAARFLLQSSFLFENDDLLRRMIVTARRFEWGEEQLVGEGTANARMQRNKGVDLIVCDTVSRLTRANQNDNTEMENVFRNIRWLAEFTGAAVILLHHNAKRSEFNDGTDWRGAMSQIGALDSWCHLQPSRNDKYLVGVQYKKFRGITPEDFSYRMDVNDPTTARLSASDEPVTLAQRLEHDPVAEALLKAITDNPGSTMPKLRDLLWPQFKDQPAKDGNIFVDQVKFTKALNNRVAAMVGRGKVMKEHNDDGKPIYKVADAPQAPKS